MEKFYIQGGPSLKGEVTISGSKNSAASILPAALLTEEECIVHNVPKISDVLSLLDLMSSIGVDVSWQSESTVKLHAKNVNPEQIDYELMDKIRMSLLLTGPLLARFGRVVFVKPGGCAIGSRPIDTHLRAFESLGAQVSYSETEIVVEAPGGLSAASMVLKEMSVTATENILLAMSLVEGESHVSLAAAEPHVTDLARVLEKMGACVEGVRSHFLTVFGQKKLSGFEHLLEPDPIEVGTFLVAGALNNSEIHISDFRPEHLPLELLILKDVGVNLQVDGSSVTVSAPKSLKSVEKIQSLPFPGFSSDLLAPFALLMTQAEGTTLIHETLYESRLMNYVPELKQMGADITLGDPHRAVVNGPSKLEGKSVISLDLRAGATLILAALIAEGESCISKISQIDRGYEKIDEKLQKLGAQIERR